MALNTPSIEQTLIVDAVAQGHSVLVDAVAGSGKTTTVCHIGKRLPDKNILLITYNKHLKFEVRTKVEDYNITNIDVQSYHSATVKYYDRNAYTDVELNEVVNDKKIPMRLIECDILIVDECQDMKVVYYLLVKKLIYDLNKNDLQLVILGDHKQCVYDYLGADYRYLTLAQQIFPEKHFILHTLQQSFRVTKSIAWFVNNAMLGENRIHSNKTGPKIDYLLENQYQAALYVASFLIKLICNGDIKPDDIFVLVPSVKNTRGKPPFLILENVLVDNNIPCFVNSVDDQKIDDDIVKGKVVFTTNNQSKGRERPVVVIFNFDGSYFKYFERESPRDTCPSKLYVAVTRASKRLILIENPQEGRLPFLKLSHEEMVASGHVEIHSKTKNILHPLKTHVACSSVHRNAVVTDIVKHVKQEHVCRIAACVQQMFSVTNKATSKLNIPSKVSSKFLNQYEDTSDINALAITFKWEYLHNPYKGLQVLIDALKGLRLPCRSNSDYLKLANIFLACSNGYHFKYAQIDDYTWMTEYMMKSCLKRIETHIPFETVKEIEMPLHTYENDTYTDFLAYLSPLYGEIRFYGRIDICTNDEVWELKCTNSLQIEHFMQVCVYAWIWELYMKLDFGPKRFMLMNIRTGEIQELDVKSPLLTEVMNLILESKFGREKSLTDDEFVNRCLAKVKACF